MAELTRAVAPERQAFAPWAPESLQETGLPPSTVEQLIMKMLYTRGDLVGRELAKAMGLRFSVIAEVMEYLKRTHMVEVKRSLGMGDISALFSLSEAGRRQARDYMEMNQYSGPAPVPDWQYSAAVRAQKLENGWLSSEALTEAYRHMVVSSEILSQIGPAVNSGKSFLIYGQPGNGKTYLAEALFNLQSSDIFVPFAIECQGTIIQVFDPVYHNRTDHQEDSISALAVEKPYDGRWARCKRPFIVTGGELALEMLDLSYNAVSKIYDAPFQIKANNGIYLIDDFGRQKVTPAEVLNRWIVPMERRVDYLSFKTGGKMVVPFETFLIFSTNLTPDRLGDEAFLRRIQYKMLLRSPETAEFAVIFERFCRSNGFEPERGLVDRFIARCYTATGKKMRRCHPRDVISHAMDHIAFQRLPRVLNDEVLDHAFHSCFAQSHGMDD